jgi:Uma2 family endonuclease
MREVHPQVWMSVEDYLATEQDLPVRHDYLDGALFAVEPPDRTHVGLVANLSTLLAGILGISRCRVLPPPVRVRAETANGFYYPDLVIACSTDSPVDSHRICRQPRLIIEVMSGASRLLDQREKRLAYQRIPSVREILLVDAEQRRLELFRRQDSRWSIDTVTKEGELLLPSLGVTLTLEAIYSGNEW